MVKKRIASVALLVGLAALLAAGAILAGNGEDSLPLDPAHAAWLDGLSPAERECLDRDPTMQQMDTLEGLSGVVILPWDNDSWGEPLADVVAAVSSVWEECIDPKNDLTLVLLTMEGVFGPLSAETEACLQDTLENFELSQSSLGEYIDVETRYSAVVGSLLIGMSKCPSAAEEREQQVRLFAKEVGRGRLTDEEMACVRQAASHDDWGLPTTINPEFMDHPVFECITPERFGEISVFEPDDDLPFKLKPGQLGCFRDLNEEKYASFLELSQDPDLSRDYSAASVFGLGPTFLCLTDEQLFSISQIYQEAKEEFSQEFAIETIRCDQELARLRLEGLRQFGWEFVLDRVDNPTDEQREFNEAAAAKLQAICPEPPMEEF